MTRAFLKNLHADDHGLWLAVEKATWRLAFAAKLPLSQVRPMPLSHVGRLCGLYLTPPDAKTKEIWLSLRDPNSKRYAMHQIFETVVHEMAHCKAGCGADHGPRFYRAFAELLVLAEDIKIRVDIAAFDGKLEP